MNKFYAHGGTPISEASLNKEFDTRPTFEQAGQLRIMDRSKGAADVDGWMTKLGEFMKGTGAIPEVPAARDYIGDEFMKMVNADPKLREFAKRSY